MSTYVEGVNSDMQCELIEEEIGSIVTLCIIQQGHKVW